MEETDYYKHIEINIDNKKLPFIPASSLEYDLETHGINTRPTKTTLPAGTLCRSQVFYVRKSETDQNKSEIIVAPTTFFIGGSKVRLIGNLTNRHKESETTLYHSIKFDIKKLESILSKGLLSGDKLSKMEKNHLKGLRSIFEPMSDDKETVYLSKGEKEAAMFSQHGYSLSIEITARKFMLEKLEAKKNRHLMISTSMSIAVLALFFPKRKIENTTVKYEIQIKQALVLSLLILIAYRAFLYLEKKNEQKNTKENELQQDPHYYDGVMIDSIPPHNSNKDQKITLPPKAILNANPKLTEIEIDQNYRFSIRMEKTEIKSKQQGMKFSNKS